MSNVKQMTADRFVEKAGTAATEFDPFVKPNGQFYDMETRMGGFNDLMIKANRRHREGVPADEGANDVGVTCGFSLYGNTKPELE